MATQATTSDCKLPVDIQIELLRHFEHIFEDAHKNRYRTHIHTAVCNLGGIALEVEPALIFNRVQMPCSTLSCRRNNSCDLPPMWWCNSVWLSQHGCKCYWIQKRMKWRQKGVSLYSLDTSIYEYCGFWRANNKRSYRAHTQQSEISRDEMVLDR